MSAQSNKLSSEAIEALILEQFGEGAILDRDHGGLQAWLSVNPENWVAACSFLKNDPRLYFDMLECLSGVDDRAKNQRIGVVYHLQSIPYGHRLVLKVWQALEAEDQSQPSIPSLSGVWRTANWHERECYDLMGIHFEGHPDLRRILLPEDWKGHPLRKDYQDEEFYHGVKIQY